MIASVLSCVIWPAATLVIWRSASFAPTLTTLCGFAPANVYAFPPIVAPAVGVAAPVTEPEPSATSPAFVAAAPEPIATDVAPVAFALLPTATLAAPPAVAPTPAASALIPVAPSLS
ncbi:hypothetical protein [Burkholderia ambifaria]|uniref:hypothetical protein n=1 Tax=Burkholderia ambifaria TaxID=152480 RepID=UPI001FC8E8B2|nr:hypothetical protein [Burkholderia ambifaria]